MEKEMLNQKITKRDFEGFLSGFSYNAYGATNINEISKIVFLRDDFINEKLAERKRANPPPTEVNKNIITEDLSEDNIHNHRIKDLFAQVEDKAFQGKTKLYQIFKNFDIDGDGFMSYQDFADCIKGMKVHASNTEVACMMKLIDKENKGYLDFTTFSKVFNPMMSSQLVKVPLNDTYLPNLGPNEDMHRYTKGKISEMNQKQDTIRDRLRPDPDQSKLSDLFLTCMTFRNCTFY